MSVWFACRDGWGNVAWPDGGAYLDQPIKLVAAFQIVASENDCWTKRMKGES